MRNIFVAFFLVSGFNVLASNPDRPGALFQESRLLSHERNVLLHRASSFFVVQSTVEKKLLESLNASDFTDSGWSNQMARITTLLLEQNRRIQSTLRAEKRILTTIYSELSPQNGDGTTTEEILSILEKSEQLFHDIQQELRNSDFKTPLSRNNIVCKKTSVESPSLTSLHPSAFDFGERTEIERPVLTATLRNDGDRTVHVTDVIRTCVCADLEISTTNLPPGGSAEVRCTLETVDGAQVGEHWKCVPARLRAPADGRDFVADLLLKPADGKDLPADGKDHPTETR